MYNTDVENDKNTMDIWGHLDELRHTLLLSLAGLGVGIVVSLFFTRPLIEFLALPVGGIQKLQAIEVTENISVYMRVTLLSGLILALPWVFYQLFQFIGKGLTKGEKRGLYFAIPLATGLFVAGAIFAYQVMLPSALQFLSTVLQVETTLRINSYFSFLTNLVFWIACSFELPLVVLVLARVGIVNGPMLVKGWRVAVVVIALLAAVITPTPDPVNMAIFMLPLFALYLLSIGLAFAAQKKNAVSQPEEN